MDFFFLQDVTEKPEWTFWPTQDQWERKMRLKNKNNKEKPIAWKFPNLMKDGNFQRQDILNTKQYTKKFIHCSIVFKLLSQRGRANPENIKMKIIGYIHGGKNNIISGWYQKQQRQEESRENYLNTRNKITINLESCMQQKVIQELKWKKHIFKQMKAKRIHHPLTYSARNSQKFV